MLYFIYLEKKIMQPKWLSSTRKHRKNGDCPSEDLAKFGYKPYKYLYINLATNWK